MYHKHPHDEIIRAWLDGRVVQYQTATGDWRDMATLTAVYEMPHFYAHTTYRIKPEVLRVRVALMRNFTSTDREPYTVSVGNLQAERATAGSKGFVRWLTDWQEYEV